MKNRIGLLMAVLMLALGLRAQAWVPTGWAYFQGSYIYSLDDDDWYYVATPGSVWCNNLNSGVWTPLNQSIVASGWDYFQGSYVYSLAAGGWFYTMGSSWCYSYANDFWSPLGVVVANPGYYWSSIQKTFRVVRGDNVTMDAYFSPQNYTEYGMPIVNGRFHFQHGIVEGNTDSDSPALYPTDGFVIDGHFETSIRAVGTVSYVYDGHITSTQNFVMTWANGVIPVFP